MSLNLNNEIFEHIKENKFVKSFINELTNSLENNLDKNENLEQNRLNQENVELDNSKNVQEDFEYKNLLAEDLTLYDTKIIGKYKDKILTKRQNILENYAENTKEGEMYYIYNVASSGKGYNLSACEKGKSHSVITISNEDLPEGAKLGSILIKKDTGFEVDFKATNEVAKQIDDMIKATIEEQNEYLSSKRIEGHIYEADEKDSGRIWLYDLKPAENSAKSVDTKSSEVTSIEAKASKTKSSEAIEEINFPENLYKDAKKGDKFIFTNGKYEKYNK